MSDYTTLTCHGHVLRRHDGIVEVDWDDDTLIKNIPNKFHSMRLLPGQNFSVRVTCKTINSISPVDVQFEYSSMGIPTKK